MSAYTATVPRGTALIVGAGIGGLSAGLALSRAGWTVRIFERAPELRATGFALSVAPNAVEALDALGVGDAVRAVAWPVGEAELRDASGGCLKRFSVAAAVGQSRSLFAPRGGPAAGTLRRRGTPPRAPGQRSHRTRPA